MSITKRKTSVKVVVDVIFCISVIMLYQICTSYTNQSTSCSLSQYVRKAISNSDFIINPKNYQQFILDVFIQMCVATIKQFPKHWYTYKFNLITLSFRSEIILTVITLSMSLNLVSQSQKPSTLWPQFINIFQLITWIDRQIPVSYTATDFFLQSSPFVSCPNSQLLYRSFFLYIATIKRVINKVHKWYRSKLN